MTAREGDTGPKNVKIRVKMIDQATNFWVPGLEVPI